MNITLNGNVVHPWNPFAPDERHTQRLKPRDFDVASSGVAGVVSFEPFILPTQARFSSEAAFKRLAGPKSWNQQQGFYIYRANRMIQSGGWSYMHAPDEHSKYARIALDFFPELDAAFRIDIAKMRVHLPPQLTARIKEPIRDLIRDAKRAYSVKEPGTPIPPRGKPTPAAPVAPAAKPAPKPQPRVSVSTPIGSEEPVGPGGPSDPISWPPPPLRRQTPKDVLLVAAEATGDVEALNRIAVRLRELNPGVAVELGW